MTQQRVRRSGLTMPIVTSRFVNNAWRRGCDFIVLDLEDSVPTHLKAHARTLIKDAIAKVAKGGAEVFVRINHDEAEADLDAAIWPGVACIKYPKTEHAHEVGALDTIITRLESERGIPVGTIEIEACIETALGVIHTYEIAASPRVREFGASSSGYDLSRDLSVEMFVDFDQFAYFRGEAELAARSLGLVVRGTPFIANTTGSVSDAKRAIRLAEAARNCGFHRGSGGVNPAVVEAHNKGYTPTEEDIRHAAWVLEQYDQLTAGRDTWIEREGHVIDRYEAARARDVLEWAELCAARDRAKAEALARSNAELTGTEEEISSSAREHARPKI